MAKPSVVVPRLLALLRRHEGVAIPRELLAARLSSRGSSLTAGSRAVDIAVSAARRSLQRGEVIESVRGTGYRLTRQKGR